MLLTKSYTKTALRFTAFSVLGSMVFFLCGTVLADTDVKVDLQGSKKVLNLGTILTGYSKAQQMIGSAQEDNGRINDLGISVTAHGATNAAMGLAAYAKAIEKIGVIASPRITLDRLHVDLQKEVKNAAAVLAGYADSEQNIGSMSGDNLTLDAVEVQSAAQIVNAAGALASHSKAIQSIGSIQVEEPSVAGEARDDQVKVKASTDNSVGNLVDQVKIKARAGSSIVNTAAAIAAQSIAEQHIGEIAASGAGDNVTVTVGGKITNAADGLAANVKADQNIGVIRGKGDLGRIDIDLEGTVENIGGGVAASADTEQEIGTMDLGKGGHGNEIKLNADRDTTISNAAAGYAGSGTAKQTVGGIFGGTLSNSSVLIEKMGSIYNFGRGIIGKGRSTQRIGVIDLGKHTGSDDRITLDLGNVSGSGAGLAGSGRVSQSIGILTAAGRDNSIEVTTGDISGTTRGILGVGTSRETIGALSGKSISNSSVTATTGDISTSAKGSGSEADISVGVLDGDSARYQQMTVVTGSITAEAIGINSRADITIGVVDGNSEVKTIPPSTTNIQVGNVHNKNESVDAKTIIEVGHVYADVTGTVKMDIKTGDLVVDTLALGASYSPGIQIGNVKGVHGGKVDHSIGSVYVSPKCLEIWVPVVGTETFCSGKSLVRIGNIGISNSSKGWDF